MTEERLDWIERWLTGWKEMYEQHPLNPCDDNYYVRMPAETAVEMGLEMVAALKDSE